MTSIQQSVPRVSVPAEFGNCRHCLQLITPAKDEIQFIEATIQSILAQTIRPAHWLIVSDGSTDGTSEKVAEFARKHQWIELLCLPTHPNRDFGSKAKALNIGYRHVMRRGFDYIGFLDADVTLPPDYLAFLIDKLMHEPAVGVVGTPYIELDKTGRERRHNRIFANLMQVPGGCQIFRRECLADIVGFTPVVNGAIDSIATTTARMKGWRTVVYPEKHFIHRRQSGRGDGLLGTLHARYSFGRKAFIVGGHPLWELTRGMHYMALRPLMLGGAAFLLGFTVAAIARHRPVSMDFVAFHRTEQRSRIRSVFGRIAAGSRRTLMSARFDHRNHS